MGLDFTTGLVEDDCIQPVRFEGNASGVYVLVDRYMVSHQARSLSQTLSEYLDGKFPTILFPFRENYRVRSQVLPDILKYGIDLTEHIPPHSRILTFGRTSYVITHDTAVSIMSHMNTVFGNTSYYAPKLMSEVWPVYSLGDIFSSDMYLSSGIVEGSSFEHLRYQIRALRRSPNTKRRILKPKIHIVNDFAGFLSDHSHEDTVAWDLETTGFHLVDDDILCITMSFDGRTGYYIPWEIVDSNALNEFFADKKQIGANLKFDCRFLHYRGITNAMPYFDTWSAGHVLDEMRSNSLKTHAWIYTNHGGYDEPLEELKRKHRIQSYGDIPISILSEYATMDAIVTYQVYEGMMRELNQKHNERLKDYFWEHVMPSLRLFVDMEPRGVHINWKHLIEQKKEIDRLLRIEEKRIYKLAGRRFGLTTDEKSRVLEEMGLPNHGLQEAKPIYAVNDETLGKWEAEGFEIAKHIRRWTSLHTILSLYVGDPGNESHDAPDEFDSTNPTTGVSWRTNDKTNAYWTYRSRKTNDTRLFPSYSVMLARSHRNRMGSPNFQQVPHHSAEDWRVRGCFMPPSPDYVISEFDYSALQLRIAAIIAPDQTMLDAFRKGMDLHSVTAHSIFTPEISIDDFLEHRKEDPYKGYRYIGKQLNFTLLFGGGAATFADRSVRPAWSIEDCMAYIEKNSLSVIDNYKTQQPDPWLTVADNLRGRFFETYRGLSCWHKKSEALAKRDGYIESPHGARRMLPQIRHIGPKERLLESKLKNISLNSPVQNFEIVIVHRAMRNLVDFFREGGYKSRLWGTVHDSLAFYLHRDEVEIMWKAIPTLMSRDYPEYNGVKFEVEGDISDYYHDPPRYWGYGVSLEEYLNECK